VEASGETEREPSASTAPIPSMLICVALLVRQVRMVDWPFTMALGFAASEAVGAGGGGVAAGGGGGTSFLQPASRTAAKVRVNRLHGSILGFNGSSHARFRAALL
jgi:hypothetical protein